MLTEECRRSSRVISPDTHWRRVAASRKGRINALAGGITLQDIRAVKAVADRLGAEKVRKLAEVLGS